MPGHLFSRTVTSWVCLSLLMGPWPARADDTIRCESRNMRYEYCRVDTGGRVELVHQRSLFGCRRDQSWGYDRHGVWVDQGCSAEFRVGRDRHGDKALVAGAAILGLAALAALASSKRQQASEEVASWSVGAFSGYDQVEATDVQLTILPGGAVNGQAGSHAFTGSLRDSHLEAGRQVFHIERSGNGFMATDERNPQHRVAFQRTGGGY